MDEDGRLEALAALGDPLRRRLYRLVAGEDHPVGRDEAAAGVGVSRSAAAFHLDRMVEDGLLEVEFKRLTGRSGPGAGRPAKLYRRAPGEIELSLPARRYELAARLLAAAASESTATGAPVGMVLERLARERGAAVAAASPDADVARTLETQGYEPRRDRRGIVLRNCPFAGVATEHAQLICGMNLALLEGFASAWPGDRISARLEPAEGQCCVRLDLASA
jgi:predicted ArsR family transcriptional regulator